MIFQRTFDDNNPAFWKFSFLSIVIRGLSILSRFFLIFYLGKFLTVKEYGTYGILNSSLMLGVYIVGFDIYVFVSRELPRSGIETQRKLILNQFALYIFSYLILIPIFSTFLSGGFLPKNIVLLFSLLLMLEHITQEYIRIFFALRYVIIANIIIFFRRVFWIVSFISASFFNRDLLTIKYLLLFWIFNHVAILIICNLFWLKIKILPIRELILDLALMRKMITTSLVFLGASISLQVMTYSNIYFIKYYYSVAEVGVFSFFANILAFIDLFIQTTLISIFLPKIIELKHSQSKEYRLFLNKMCKAIIALVGIAAIMLGVLIKPLLILVAKDVFMANLSIFYILLLGYILFGLSNIGHYILYINNSEKFILYSSLICCITNLVFNYSLIPKYGIKGASLSLVISMLMLLLLKLLWARAAVKRVVIHS